MFSWLDLEGDPPGKSGSMAPGEEGRDEMWWRGQKKK